MTATTDPQAPYATPESTAPLLAGVTGEGESPIERESAFLVELMQSRATSATHYDEYWPKSTDAGFMRAAGEMITKLLAENAALRAKLATEGEQERELLKLMKELRGLRAMNEALEMVRAAHMQKEKQAIAVLMAFPEYEEAAALVSAQNDGAGPLLGDSGKEQQGE